jgi:xanthine/CO dehydrogenase XdhC/CoxF family maturation factor
MLVAGDGSTTGNVSGGCLEADVREVALQVIASGAAQSREYCAGSDEIAAWDLGVGCEGVVDVFVQPAFDGDGLHDALRALRAFEPFRCVTDLRTGAMVVDRGDAGREALESGIRTIDGHEVFVDVLRPPPTLLILSAGEDARHLARFAGDVGFRVIVADHRPAFLDASRFSRGTTLLTVRPDEIATHVHIDDETYVVSMHHNFADDRDSLKSVLQTATPYIGMLGPRQRTERMIAAIGGVGARDDARIYGPVGLDIGTDGAEQVALAVIAELLAVRSGRRPRSLRERTVPIHADATG